MPEEVSENLLIEEYKNAADHQRFLEARRDRFVIGSLTASGAVLALTAQLFAKDDFHLHQANPELIVVLFILYLSLAFLSWFLCTAYRSLSVVIKHHTDVIEMARREIFDGWLVKTDTGDQCLVDILKIDIGTSQAKRPFLSTLSLRILRVSGVAWFLAAIALFGVRFVHC